jgi:hypothetical protein
MHTSTSIERRKYTCDVCGREVVVEVKVIEKFVAVCLHEATRGGPLPVFQLREEGKLVTD